MSTSSRFPMALTSGLLVLVAGCGGPPAETPEDAAAPAENAATEAAPPAASPGETPSESAGSEDPLTVAAPGEIDVPDGFPDRMPLPRGTAGVAFLDDASLVGVSLNHPAEAAALIAFYEEQLPAHGWEFGDSPAAAYAASLSDGIRMWDVTGHGLTGSITISDLAAGPRLRLVGISIERP